MVANTYSASSALLRAPEKLFPAIKILQQDPIMCQWYIQACEAGYEFGTKIDRNSSLAEHNNAGKHLKKPNIIVPENSSPEGQAEALGHELSHYVYGREGRPGVVKTRPVDSILANCLEEAFVCAATAQTARRISEGVGIDGKKNPEMWQAHLRTSLYTAKAYAKAVRTPEQIENGVAFAAALKAFFTIPNQRYLSNYHNAPLNTMKAFLEDGDTDNPNYFTQKFGMNDFWKKVPDPFKPYQSLLKDFKPLENLVLTEETAETIRSAVVKSREEKLGPAAVNWPMRVIASRFGGTNILGAGGSAIIVPGQMTIKESVTHALQTGGMCAPC